MKYFGYAWGTNVDAVKSYCNIHTLVPFSFDSVEENLQQFTNAGMKAILSLQLIICDTATGKLLSDWSTRLSLWKSKQGTSIDQRVLAIMLPDEAYHLGYTAKQIQAVSQKLSALFPAHGQLLIESYSKIRQLYTIKYPVPSAVKWVGFDRYGVLPLTDEEYQKDFKYLRSKLRPNQKIMLVGEGQWIELYEEYGLPETIMGDIILSYEEIAKDAKVDGLLVYCWPNDFEYPGYVGSEGLPQSVKDIHVQIGKRMTGK